MYCTRAPCFARRVASFHLSIMATPDTIAHVLASTLNPDSSVRIAAELNLSELLKSPRKVAVCLPLSSLTGHRRVGALTYTTRALSGCRVVSTTDECFILSCVCTGRFLMTVYVLRPALGNHHTSEVREGTLVSVFPTV